MLCSSLSHGRASGTVCGGEWWGAIAQCSYRLLASWWHLLPCLQSVCWYIGNFRPTDWSQGVKELSNVSWAKLAGSLSKGRRHTSQKEILGLHFLGILLVCLLAMELTVFHWQLKLFSRGKRSHLPFMHQTLQSWSTKQKPLKCKRWSFILQISNYG